ncbi:hypothetical protein [Bradyrhizobium sp. BRP56]|uniref:hypothetical protein n=1 Tax=Bradyrhizobium sp. BRP56 TaxID=2793819 RepID=UPI001CD36166|nr:hypothetical protein [Bradyrhizobium sp. BRP56]MCA1397224.1 hypothetical protein [Bradyrhizobium sp. BRP56]
MEHLLVVAATCIKPLIRIDGLAPMAACALHIPPHGAPQLYVLGGCERATDTWLARAILHALQVVDRGEGETIACISKEHVWITAQKRVSQSLRSGDLTMDGLPAWAELDRIGKLPHIIKRAPASPQEGFWLEGCGAIAKAINKDVLADFRLNPERYIVPGITWTDCQPVPPQLLAPAG